MNSARTMPCVLVLPPRSNPPGFHSSRICFSKAVDDGVDVRVFVRNRPFLGDLQAFVGTPHVDQARSSGARWDRAAGASNAGRIERIKAAFQMYQRGRGIAQPVQERRAGIGLRLRTTRVGTEVCDKSRALGRDLCAQLWRRSGTFVNGKKVPVTPYCERLPLYTGARFASARITSAAFSPIM